ncbi:TonB-dependent receptor [Kordiimonas marina]|uniref:TonB-dependent receptor n=1 Tax=Kordiimonas marina TaxID=2872312 RepID=UPI001FF27E15|nr:TonB-dependent receptor [Kordiimonas marina]MCJ9430548.1 TonB-dependent receptor [Kordiimonas marina]
MLAAAVLGTALSASAQAAVSRYATARQQFDLPPCPLSDALLRYSELTGLGLVFDSRLVAGRTAPEIKGVYPVHEVLERLLAGTGLRIRDVGGNILTIVPAPKTDTVETADADAAPGTDAPPAYTADVGAPIDELLIVATRTANPPYSKFIPSTSLDGQKLHFSGTVNVADELFQMPSVLSDITASNTAFYGTPAGFNLADLRGLGTQRTLVLVNGRRYTPSFGGSLSLYGVDLNTVSASLIDRVEVLTGGAATSYGGDALAGVINFVMRDKYDGTSISMQGGLTDRGDHNEFLGTLTYGTEFAGGRGNVMASMSIDRQGGLFLSDRQVTSDPSGYALNGVPQPYGQGVFTRGFARSNVVPRGGFDAFVRADGSLIDAGNFFYFTKDGHGLEPYTGHKQQRYQYAKDSTLVTPIDRIFGTLSVKYEITPDRRLILETSFADTEIVSQLAPLPFTIGTGLVNQSGFVSVPLDNPFVPDVIRQYLADNNITDASGVLVERRAVELGPRRTHIQRRSYRVMMGLQGSFSGNWSYDAYYQYGRNSVHEVRDGLMDLANYKIALDPALCASFPLCSLINPFGENKITPQQAAFYRAQDAERSIHTDEHILSAVASGPFTLGPLGDSTVSVGLEYRSESLADTPDPGLIKRPVAGTFTFPGSNGKFHVVEAFTDITLPILKDVRFAKELTVSSGVRLSDYSSVGATSIWHVSSYWEPTPGVMFRASYQKGKRAPDIAELYAGGPNSYYPVTDPCTNPASDVVAANCASDGPLGVPDGVVERAVGVGVQRYGNPDLKAEDASNLTVGFTVDTGQFWRNFPGALRFSVDAFRIRVKNFIVNLGESTILNSCYGSAGLSDPYCGNNPATGEPYIQRDSGTGELTTVSSSLINSGRFAIEGVDVDLQYSLDFRSIARHFPLDYFTLTGRYTRNAQVDFQYSADGAVYDALGEAKYPRNRFQVSSSFTRGDVTLDWDIRYRGASVSSNQFKDLKDAQIPAIWYHDVSARWEIRDGATLYAGVRNLFDRKAPRIFYGSVADTMPEYFDVLGRRFYAGLIFDF